jgi:hypothetical protein
MARLESWGIETLGYEDWNGDRWEGPPTDEPEDAAGLWVHTWNLETGEENYTWIWVYEPKDWDDWVLHLLLVLEADYGIEL